MSIVDDERKGKERKSEEKSRDFRINLMRRRKRSGESVESVELQRRFVCLLAANEMKGKGAKCEQGNVRDLLLKFLCALLLSSFPGGSER